VAFELEEETISSLREKLSSGKYTSEQLVQLYLDRIETIDKNGLELHSIRSKFGGHSHCKDDGCRNESG
jgi:amidase